MILLVLIYGFQDFIINITHANVKHFVLILEKSAALVWTTKVYYCIEAYLFSYFLNYMRTTKLWDSWETRTFVLQYMHLGIWWMYNIYFGTKNMNIILISFFLRTDNRQKSAIRRIVMSTCVLILNQLWFLWELSQIFVIVSSKELDFLLVFRVPLYVHVTKYF